MASMDTLWQPVQRSDRVQEYFMIGEFIQTHNWEESSPPNFSPNNYPYLNDCIEFNGKEYGRYIKNEIRVTEITHGTSCENMLSIIKDGGFRPHTKCIPGIGYMDLVWFGLKIGETEIDCVKENFIRTAQDLLQYGFSKSTVDSVTSRFAITAPFQPMSRYGNFKFTLSIQEVLDEYEMQFCASLFGYRRPEMVKLGTFAYKMETMHVILVCPPGTMINDQCPQLSDDPIIQPDEKFRTWIWRPHSTLDQKVSITRSGKVLAFGKRWEHVVFAFYVPKGHCLTIANLNDRVSLCLALNKYYHVSGVNAAINTMLESIALEEPSKRKSLANMLTRMISDYFYEMHLYKKTIATDFEREDLIIDLEWVAQKFRGLGLNWSPPIC